MSDALTELISQNLDNNLKNKDYLSFIPARIIERQENGLYVVETIADQIRYILPNWTAQSLNPNDSVKIYYKDNISRSGYIGATLNLNDYDSKIDYTVGSALVGTVATKRAISKINFTMKQNAAVFVTLNANLFGSSEGYCIADLEVDGTPFPYQCKALVGANDHIIFTMSLPVDVQTGHHEIIIYAQGAGTFTDIYAYLWGQGLDGEINYDDTDENDYIYNGGTILYYIGTSTRPKVPEKLNNVKVTRIASTAFNGSDIVAVKMPEGVEVIE